MTLRPRNPALRRDVGPLRTGGRLVAERRVLDTPDGPVAVWMLVDGAGASRPSGASGWPTSRPPRGLRRKHL